MGRTHPTDIEQVFYNCGVGGMSGEQDQVASGPLYAELHAHSAYTFGAGAATPEQMVRAASDLGLSALGLLDVDGMYSAIQADHAGRQHGLPIVHGAEFTLHPGAAGLAAGGELPPGWGLPAGAEDPGLRVPILACSPQGYRDLCRALSDFALSHPGRRDYAHDVERLASLHTGQWLVLTGSGHGPLRRLIYATPPAERRRAAARYVSVLRDLFGPDGVAIEAHLLPTDEAALADTLAQVASDVGVPLVATGAVYADTPRRQALADVLTATRLRQPLAKIEQHLVAGGRFLRSAQEMLHIHRRHPHAVQTAGELGAELAFDLSLLAPELPTTRVPEGHTDASWLRELTYRGAQVKYGDRAANPDAWAVIDKELRIIEALDFPGYFLIVKDIVDYCARSGIWCQGRGSAANSAVCYALNITAVDAVRHRMMFERFLSEGRSGPPDIDIDIESDRREEVIQYVYDTYGRQNAAQVATVLTYRSRSAIYDASRALGFDEERSRAWAQGVSRWMWIDGVRSVVEAVKGGSSHEEEQSAGSRLPVMVAKIASALQDLPRHTGIHSGGMVLTRTPVSEICPVMWAATLGRTVLQWDKEDCADAGLVKFDLLGLGMLSAVRRAFTWLEEAGVVSEDGRPYGLHHLPAEDPAVYDLLCAADAIGVFQVESRAQLNTLPRMQPRCFYDLVIEVALIRPGPIQGQSVNPYLRRRRGEEEITYPHELLRPALEKTLGVPLFQEQLMQIAVDIAGFTPGEADELRRAMGAKRSPQRMKALEPRLLAGMAERGIVGEVAQGIVEKLHAFADFGFPESHSFSFAFLVYASSWLKVHAPEFFYAGVIASQPMGFYSVSTLVHDARRHGVNVARPDVNYSQVLTHPRRLTLPNDEAATGQEALGARRWQRHVHTCNDWELRLGLHQVNGLKTQIAQRIVDARADGPFTSINDCVARCHLSKDDVQILAQSGAFESIEPQRRHAMWLAGQVPTHRSAAAHHKLPEEQLTLPGLETLVASPGFAPLSSLATIGADYSTLGVSPEGHPFVAYRPMMEAHGVRRADSVGAADAGRIIEVAGVITHRQSPATGKGVVFLSLEDESGLSNITCSVGMWKRYRARISGAAAVRVRGMVEHGHGAITILAHHIEPLPTLGGIEESARGGRGGF